MTILECNPGRSRFEKRYVIDGFSPNTSRFRIPLCRQMICAGRLISLIRMMQNGSELLPFLLIALNIQIACENRRQRKSLLCYMIDYLGDLGYPISPIFRSVAMNEMRSDHADARKCVFRRCFYIQCGKAAIEIPLVSCERCVGKVMY